MLEIYLALLRQIRQVWRHWVLASIVAFVTAGAGWVVVAQLPDEYRADTRLYVDTASMLNRVLAGVAMDSAEVDQEFLRVAQRSLLSRPNLEAIARETDLYIGAGTEEQQEALLTRLAGDIGVRAESTRPRGPENIFRLSYRHQDPEMALAVVREVHDVFIESVLGYTRRDTEKLDTFLDRQIAHYETRLDDAEERRKRFRQENAGLVPGEGQDYFSMLQTARDRLREAELALTRAQRVRDDLQQQVEALGEASAGASGPPGNVADATAQLRLLEQRLRELESRYTDQHPDVVATRRELARLRGVVGDSDTAGGASTDETSLAYRFRVQDLRTELARAQAAVASEQAAVDEYRARKDQLEDAVSTIPAVEAEMARLNRDYNVVRRQFEELVSRRESARMTREADLTVDEGMFQVIEPPHVGSLPVGPNRPLLATVVLAGALGSGGGLALLMSLLRPTFGDVSQLRGETGVHVLGRVGIVRTHREEIRRRLRFVLFVLAVLILFGIYLVMVLRYLQII